MIEDAQGLRNLEEILDGCHGAMVARGHLGLEITPEKVALAQNFCICKTNIRGKVCACCAAMIFLSNLAKGSARVHYRLTTAALATQFRPSNVAAGAHVHP
jgi:hypothetical protein